MHAWIRLSMSFDRFTRFSCSKYASNLDSMLSTIGFQLFLVSARLLQSECSPFVVVDEVSKTGCINHCQLQSDAVLLDI